PIPEPGHEIEKPEDLACYPEGKRPATFLFPPALAAQEARGQLAWHAGARLDHEEAWEAHALLAQGRLAEALGPMPDPVKPEAQRGGSETSGKTVTTSYTIEVEKG